MIEPRSEPSFVSLSVLTNLLYCLSHRGSLLSSEGMMQRGYYLIREYLEKSNQDGEASGNPEPKW